jgi:hypothetical protein
LDLQLPKQTVAITTFLLKSIIKLLTFGVLVGSGLVGISILTLTCFGADSRSMDFWDILTLGLSDFSGVPSFFASSAFFCCSAFQDYQ